MMWSGPNSMRSPRLSGTPAVFGSLFSTPAYPARHLDPHPLDGFSSIGRAHSEDQLCVALGHEPRSHIFVWNLERVGYLCVPRDGAFQLPSVVSQRRGHTRSIAGCTASLISRRT